jgi:hypothetical protein
MYVYLHQYLARSTCMYAAANKFRTCINSTFYIYYTAFPRSIREPLRALGPAVVYSCETRAQHLKPPPCIPTALYGCLLRADFAAVLIDAQLVRSSNALLLQV